MQVRSFFTIKSYNPQLVELLPSLSPRQILALLNTTYLVKFKHRNNPAAGVALAGLLIATGNIVRVAFAAEFQNWLVSFTQYGLVLLFCLGLLVAIRWLADLLLVPGVKISQAIRQEVPNLGAGLIEAFAYIAASLLIAWCFA
jgi:uncharacterized membrane protein YjfL (UPF0719 family)